jgi:hypothetical protein
MASERSEKERRKPLEGAVSVFVSGRDTVGIAVDLNSAACEVKLTLQNDFLSGALNKTGLLSA